MKVESKSSITNFLDLNIKVINNIDTMIRNKKKNML